ncbi:MAG: molybdenum cofactor guanylyltransferase [Actinomycetota bacterium]
MSFDAVILAGGGARRLGGADKALLEVGGRRLLDRVLAAVRGARRVFVVGPRRDTAPPGDHGRAEPPVEQMRAGQPGPSRAPRAIEWLREEPPGGGPVAALHAALYELGAPLVVVLAVDLPFVDAGLVERLVRSVGADGAIDGAILVDRDGRDQPLAGAYRVESLRARLPRNSSPAGASVRALVDGMMLARIEDEGAALDCDTWDEVAAARRRHGGGDDVG